MKGFVFRLQPVLDMRQREERERQRVVAQLERERVGLENELRTCQETVSREREDLRDRLIGGAIDVSGARWQAHASLDAMRRSKHAALKLAGVFAKLELARRSLMTATSRRRAVELLRDRQYEAWKAEQAKRERLELDEIGSRLARNEHEPSPEAGDA
ncbi:MAG: flagellar export protein FliJ [Phycisphaerales bacterium]